MPSRSIRMSETMRSEQALDQAVTWIARLRADDVTAVNKHAFSEWLSASDENRKAFDESFALWEDLAVVGKLPFEDFSVASPRVTSFQFSPFPLAAAAVLLVSVIGSLLIFSTPTYQTEVGEQSTLTLADGSVLNLNTATSIRVDFSGDERAIDLMNGEAFFEVKSESTRPFVVSACESTIIAVGTAFNVRCEDGNMTVTVSEGKVQVTDSSSSFLSAAEQIMRLDSSGLQPVTKVNTDNVTAWRKQLHVYDGVPLSVVVADLNRYARQQIRVDDDDLAQIEVVARYKMTDRELTLASLEKTFPLRAVHVSDEEIALLPVE